MMVRLRRGARAGIFFLLVLFSIWLLGGCTDGLAASESSDPESTTSSTTVPSTAASSTSTSAAVPTTTTSSVTAPTAAPLVFEELTPIEQMIVTHLESIHSGEGWQDRYREAVLKPESFAFLDDPEYEARHWGVLNVLSARVVDICEIPIRYDSSIGQRGLDHSPDYKVYLVGVDTVAAVDNAFYFTGIDYSLVTLVNVNGAWLIENEASAGVEAVRRFANPLLTADYLKYRGYM